MEIKKWKCDDCEREINTFNRIIIWINMQEHKKQLCNICTKKLEERII